jgi:hypothetical protein
MIFDPLQPPVDTEHGRIAGADVQVRGPMLDHHFEQDINLSQIKPPKRQAHRASVPLFSPKSEKKG